MYKEIILTVRKKKTLKKTLGKKDSSAQLPVRWYREERKGGKAGGDFSSRLGNQEVGEKRAPDPPVGILYTEYSPTTIESQSSPTSVRARSLDRLHATFLIEKFNSFTLVCPTTKKKPNCLNITFRVDKLVCV